MRVIGGEFRSRRLKSASGLATRPTPDRLREALFNVLAPRIVDAVFVDAYAGTGAVGIEALSRGARRAVFIERSRGALAVLGENLRTLGLEDRARVVSGKVTLWLDKFTAGIVFLDPPYELEREYMASLELLGAAAPPLVVVQHATRYRLPDEAGSLLAYRTIRQGDNALTFFAPR
ncbi:MAG: 16S rRNA (guanine(966)-N(2))-methyltransferase RsmD [Bryobacterales bacterium]|nr:16S rRNA (guanine(966)-N(2))-methyltransferase RsmD [Bryobacterales bacterium]